MSEPASASEARSRESVSDEIGRSLSSIWHRRDGSGPVTIETEYVGDVVRCVIHEGDPPADRPADHPTGSTDSIGYRHEAQSTVARLTRRSVKAYVAKRDKKTGRATNTFIVEPIQTKY